MPIELPPYTRPLCHFNHLMESWEVALACRDRCSVLWMKEGRRNRRENYTRRSRPRSETTCWFAPTHAHTHVRGFVSRLRFIPSSIPPTLSPSLPSPALHPSLDGSTGKPVYKCVFLSPYLPLCLSLYTPLPPSPLSLLSLLPCLPPSTCLSLTRPLFSQTLLSSQPLSLPNHAVISLYFLSPSIPPSLFLNLSLLSLSSSPLSPFLPQPLSQTLSIPLLLSLSTLSIPQTSYLSFLPPPSLPPPLSLSRSLSLSLSLSPVHTELLLSVNASQSTWVFSGCGNGMFAVGCFTRRLSLVIHWKLWNVLVSTQVFINLK